MNLLAGNPLLRVAPATLPPPITVLVRCDKRRERPILQAHGFPAPRFQRWPRASVPSDSLTALAEPIFVHVDVEYPISDTLDQFINPLPITAAHPCPYCGRYPGHHDWCGRPNVRVSFHPKKLIGLDGTWHATGSEA